MDKQVENRLTQNLDKLSNGSKMAIVMCANAFRFGANWGLLRKSNSEYKGILEALKEEKQNTRVTMVENGCIIECKEQFLANAVNTAVPNAIDGEFVNIAVKRKEDEKGKFRKFVKNAVDGKNKYVTQCNGYKEFVVGLYCVNDTNFIRINGKDIPSYKLTLAEALPALKMFLEAGMQVYIPVEVSEGNVKFMPIGECVPNAIPQVFKAMEISDTDTGVFLTVRIK